jgi:hypothetical protein
VAGVSQRVECSYKQLGNNGEYKQLDLLLADIASAWSSLESYYLKAEIPVSSITTKIEESFTVKDKSCHSF